MLDYCVNIPIELTKYERIPQRYEHRFSLNIERTVFQRAFRAHTPVAAKRGCFVSADADSVARCRSPAACLLL